MLDDMDDMDMQSLLEALSNFYYSNGKTFDGLRINPGNEAKFDSIRDWAIEYYDTR